MTSHKVELIEPEREISGSTLGRLKGMDRLRSFLRGEFEGEIRVPFWHEELRQTRRQVGREWLKTTTILCIAILAILSIFWGALLHTEENLEAFDVLVVDFDGLVDPYRGVDPFVGPLVVEAAHHAQQAPGYHITYKFAPASDFNNDPTHVREAIWHFDHWAAIVINPNATALLQEAIRIGNSSYDPSAVCTTTYVTARDQVATGYFTPQLKAFQVAATSLVGNSWARLVMSDINDSTNITVIAAAPQALSPAIGFTTYDLRPLRPAEVTPAVTVGLIYLIIVAFFSFTFFLPTHGHFISEMEGHNKIYFAHLVVWKYCSTVGAYFFMSLAYSLVSLAFQIPFTSPPGSHVEVVSPANGYGNASFFVYWMINFIGMCALGLACENIAMLLGNPWVALWLIFWVITNVSTAFYPITAAPALYTYGYAWPLHAVVEATRVILFDVRSRMGLHVGILLAWWAVNTALFPVCARWLRYQFCVKRKREMAAKVQAQEKSG